MNGLHNQQDRTLPILVIGIHREELAFGRSVADVVPNSVRIVQIDKGLSHKKSFYKSGFYHSTVHREIYLQLHQQIKGKTDLIIDLHTGINTSGRCADILSAEVSMLCRIKKQLDNVKYHPLSPPGEERLYEIIPTDKRREKGRSLFPACHTIIPRRIWDEPTYIYVGLEIYLQESGEGTPTDFEYATKLIHMLCLATDDAKNTQKD